MFVNQEEPVLTATPPPLPPPHLVFPSETYKKIINVSCPLKLIILDMRSKKIVIFSGAF
jgi:hypothetical protein